MERFHHPVTDPHSRVSRNIMIRAGRLARSGAVPGMTADDIAQELREHLWRRDGAFDPARGSYDTFADRVIVNRIATLASPTERLRAERAWVGLDDPAPGARADEALPLADTLADTDAMYAPAPRAADEAIGLVHDMCRLLDGLSPACRAVAHALADLTPTEAATALGVNRSTVYARLGAIRAAAVAIGLDAYLGAAPTHPAPGR
ncbi:MAG: sigma-70 family RNA polymerase sigma factor [Maritimibacter sp.]|nr:sigma-70 family RNA polymerase sigma factor [Maritimibacter sp.]